MQSFFLSYLFNPKLTIFQNSTGSLPWQDMNMGNSERNWEKVKEIKMRASIEVA